LCLQFGRCVDAEEGDRAMNGVQRITDHDVSQVVESMRETTRDRDIYARCVLRDFGYALAKKAANPAAFVCEAEEGWSEVNELVTEWAKRSAAELDELLSSTY
jgi:hypothetical protein